MQPVLPRSSARPALGERAGGKRLTARQDAHGHDETQSSHDAQGSRLRSTPRRISRAPLGSCALPTFFRSPFSTTSSSPGMPSSTTRCSCEGRFRTSRARAERPGHPPGPPGGSGVAVARRRSPRTHRTVGRVERPETRPASPWTRPPSPERMSPDQLGRLRMRPEGESHGRRGLPQISMVGGYSPRARRSARSPHRSQNRHRSGHRTSTSARHSGHRTTTRT